LKSDQSAKCGRGFVAGSNAENPPSLQALATLWSDRFSRRAYSAPAFPKYSDDLVLRDFAVYLGLVVATLLCSCWCLTSLNCLSDIFRQPRASGDRGEYLIGLYPRRYTSRCCP